MESVQEWYLEWRIRKTLVIRNGSKKNLCILVILRTLWQGRNVVEDHIYIAKYRKLCKFIIKLYKWTKKKIVTKVILHTDWTLWDTSASFLGISGFLSLPEWQAGGWGCDTIDCHPDINNNHHHPYHCYHHNAMNNITNYYILRTI